MKARPDMSMRDYVISMSEGNPGAATVAIRLLQESEAIGSFTLVRLDESGIYGPDIWIGYKDVCGEDLALFAEKVNAGTLRGEIDARARIKRSVAASMGIDGHVCPEPSACTCAPGAGGCDR